MAALLCHSLFQVARTLPAGGCRAEAAGLGTQSMGTFTCMPGHCMHARGKGGWGRRVSQFNVVHLLGHICPGQKPATNRVPLPGESWTQVRSTVHLAYCFPWGESSAHSLGYAGGKIEKRVKKKKDPLKSGGSLFLLAGLPKTLMALVESVIRRLPNSLCPTWKNPWQVMWMFFKGFY
jgi:hypothetical protein